MSVLPNGWSKSLLAKLGVWTGGGTPTTSNAAYWENGTIPWVSPKDMKQRRITTAQDSITEAAVKASTTNLIAENSVMIVTRSGILRHSLPVATNTKPVTLNQDMKALTPWKGLDYNYLYFAFRCFEREILHTCCKGGTTVQSVESPRLMGLEFPIPPTNEQHRIVAKIEELFSELDAGVASLKQARAQLAVYRQALLKHAFEGKLTAEWRARHADQLESAEKILTRIRTERDARYQQQLNEWKKARTNGEESPKPRELASWSELSASEIEELPSLPLGWHWMPFSNLCRIIRNGISAKPTGDTGDKILRISAVRPLKVDLNDFRYIQGRADAYEDYVLEIGDLLFTRYNGSRKFVGVCGHFKGTERRLFPDKLIQGKLGVESVLPGFVEAAFGCGASRKFVETRIRTTAGQAGVSGGDIKAVPIPVCSFAEQQEIVRILEENLPNIDTLEADIDQNLQRAEALRQAILKKAFAGELVPQDPSDETAAALLARIQAERVAQAAAVAVAKTAKPRKIKAS